jgi:hypothetical protein
VAGRASGSEIGAKLTITAGLDDFFAFKVRFFYIPFRRALALSTAAPAAVARPPRPRELGAPVVLFFLGAGLTVVSSANIAFYKRVLARVGRVISAILNTM